MSVAEDFAFPIEAQLGTTFPRRNDFGELFYLRWGKIRFEVNWGPELNIKVLLKVYRSDGICELFIMDTDAAASALEWTSACDTRFLHSSLSSRSGSSHRGEVHLHRSPGRAFVPVATRIHLHGWLSLRRRRIPTPQRIVRSRNAKRLGDLEADPAMLQRDVDWINGHFESLNLVPKFTKGAALPSLSSQALHPRSDRRHNCQKHARYPDRLVTIKVCVDCIDDTDFVNHLLHAAANGVWVQCQVDWRKMTLTNSHNYVRLKRSGIELLGVFCTPKHSKIEVAPDMHNKFIIFGDRDAMLGSFNITFDRWGANWESGMAFHSKGLCRLLDNIFQSIRGGVIQKYFIDPLSHFNLLYTFGRQSLPRGRHYRPNQAILSEIHRAQWSIKLCLFLLGEMTGEYEDSVVDALIQARGRGVDVQVILNGHLARRAIRAKNARWRKN